MLKRITLIAFPFQFVEKSLKIDALFSIIELEFQFTSNCLNDCHQFELTQTLNGSLLTIQEMSKQVNSFLHRLWIILLFFIGRITVG